MEKEKHSGRGVTFLFLGFLGVLSLLSIVTPQKAFSDSENRYLQGKPGAAAVSESFCGFRAERRV